MAHEKGTKVVAVSREGSVAHEVEVKVVMVSRKGAPAHHEAKQR